MGYWGTLIAVQSNGRNLAALTDRSAELRVDGSARRGDGWQVYSLPDNLVVGDTDGALPRLVKESDAPVVAAYVADSDYGQLAGLSPVHGQWETWLDANTARRFERDYLVMKGMSKADADRQAQQMIAGFGLPPAEAAKRATQWAREAGYAVPAGPIRQVLASRRPPGASALLRLPWKRYVFAEEMFFALLDNLGLPRVVND
ncbi:hypothetical protein DLJ46_23950 [Micromonospora globispora]|uniref:Uncharacterized protein n=1 Tax=Micromonospora globispora TaxID=1450148 RepID=A0A317JVK6_9ACTN|nr:hypothetical protein DLJ46_23950 [Micromonospora globispora]RQW92767.1 hypothetical protein DKL51_18415 [Micromonospora globispora]